MVGSKGMANFKVVYACVYECERRDKVTPQTLKHWARVTREERSNPERGGVGWLGLACLREQRASGGCAGDWHALRNALFRCRH
jgi:hypothetical protein